MSELDNTKSELIDDAALRAKRYIDSAPGHRVYPSSAAIDALRKFQSRLPDHPTDPKTVLALLDEVGSPATVRSTSGRYFGFVNGNSEPIGTAAMILATAWDQNLALPIMSPVAARLDEIAANWICELLRLPSSSCATFCAGATVANLTCLVAGRDRLLAKLGWDVATRGIFEAPPLKVVTSQEIHASVLKSLRVAGFGTAAVTFVETDARGCVRPELFPETDERTLVVLQAGNVNTGYSDPFDEIIPKAKSNGAWVHVDGAFGLWAAASPSQSHHTKGVDDANSWATDAHKWLNAPYDSGIAICADEKDLRRAMHVDAEYLHTNAERALLQLGLQMSQRARAIDTWAIIASKGRSGIGRMVEHCCSLAAHAADALARGGAELLVPPALNQVLVAFGHQTARVIEEVQRDGTCWAGGTTWKGREAMRVSLCDTSTTKGDVNASVAAILHCWDNVRRN